MSSEPQPPKPVEQVIVVEKPIIKYTLYDKKTQTSKQYKEDEFELYQKDLKAIRSEERLEEEKRQEEKRREDEEFQKENDRKRDEFFTNGNKSNVGTRCLCGAMFGNKDHWKHHRKSYCRLLVKP